MTIRERIQQGLLAAIAGAFLLAPIYWIFSISVQPGDVAYNGRYEVIPSSLTRNAYASLVNNDRGIRGALIHSAIYSGVSSIAAMALALIAVFLVKADRTSAAVRRRIALGCIGIFFLPSFAVFPGFRAFFNLLGLGTNTTLQLVVAHTVFGFVLAFVLLVLVFGRGRNPLFDQLLSETQSRGRAYALGLVVPNLPETVAVGGLVFSTIWSEFFLSSLISAADHLKPFSVVLQMAAGQYRTEFSHLAAGAVASLAVWAALTAILLVASLIVRERVLRP